MNKKELFSRYLLDNASLNEELLSEAPMDNRFAKEWERDCKVLLTHIKHELSKGPKGQTRAQLQLYSKEITKAMEVPKKLAKIVGEQ